VAGPAPEMYGPARSRMPLVKSDKRVTKAVDSGDYDKLREAISKSSDDPRACMGAHCEVD
jgi:hypothetical protein